jgi:polysaccharide biosynthesis protein PslH
MTSPAADEVLFLAHRIPFPPDRGDKIRSHHVLRHIASRAPVHVATFADDPFDMAEEPALARLAASHCLVHRAKPLALAGVEALLSGRPVSLTAFRSEMLARYVAKVLATRPIRAIYVFSGQMGQYVPKDWRGRLVTDFVDVDSAKFEAYAQDASWPRAWIDAREGRRLAAEEARLAAKSDVSLLVSEAEADLFRSRLPQEMRADVRAIGNGIDCTVFDPVSVKPSPEVVAAGGPRIVFTGQMDYAPNIAAAKRAIEAILPSVRAALPEATLHIVGRNPPETLTTLHGRDGAHVWGRVPDIRPWLAAADIALVPLAIARGIQNKVLEAMAMELPVVCTSGAATGIAAQPGRDIMVADEDAALADAVIGLWRDRAAARAMGEAARRFVIAEADWGARLADLGDLLGLASDKARDAA